ncbi:MAG TPA: MEKHLA domain-containing protein [Verrucomicrobiae bacterium]|nr:MEKHLA domain-containing protein [Verrucomicrobiae bacterium]
MNSPWQTESVVAHTGLLARSLKQLTGRDLLPGNFLELELARKVFEAPFVVVSHGTEADPVLNYGNQAALDLWEMSWEEFTRTPSRLTAEAPRREERAELLDAAMRRGFIDNYAGVRISKNGRRFEISRATIWNLVSETGEPRGQAAAFCEWRFL